MIIYGKQIFWHIVEKHPQMIEEVMLSKKLPQKEFSRVSRLGKKIVILDNQKAQALATGGNHQGFFLKIFPLQFASVDLLKTVSSVVVLNSLTDVGNIGSIIRTSYALGVEAIVIAGLKDFKLENTIRTSSGATIEMPIILYPQTLELINYLKTNSFTTIASTIKGENVNHYKKNGKIALIFGSEGDGLPSRVINSCSLSLAIKMRGDFDSLNVSNAASIMIDRIFNDG